MGRAAAGVAEDWLPHRAPLRKEYAGGREKERPSLWGEGGVVLVREVWLGLREDAVLVKAAYWVRFQIGDHFVQHTLPAD